MASSAGRIRTIKPEFFASPSTAKADPVLRLAYIGLWCWADDTGHGTANPKELDGFIFPNDDIAELSGGRYAAFGGLLRPLAATFGVLFYEVEGRPYFEIPSWNKHQRIRGDRGTQFPLPEDGTPLFTSENIDDETSGGNWPQMAATGGHFPPGTGEQRNRGTGEQGNSFALTNVSAQNNAGSHEPATNNTPTPQHKKRKTPEDYGHDFATFWHTFPNTRKAGLKKPATIFTRIIRNGEATAQEIINGAHQYANDPNREEKYTQSPEAWLNQSKWLAPPLPDTHTNNLTRSQRAALADMKTALAQRQQPTQLRVIEGGEITA